MRTPRSPAADEGPCNALQSHPCKIQSLLLLLLQQVDQHLVLHAWNGSASLTEPGDWSRSLLCSTEFVHSIDHVSVHKNRYVIPRGHIRTVLGRVPLTPPLVQNNKRTVHTITLLRYSSVSIPKLTFTRSHTERQAYTKASHHIPYIYTYIYIYIYIYTII